MAEGNPRVDEVFNAARRLSDPAARRAYLDQACDGDLGMRARLEALLRAYEEADSFLRSPVVDPSAVPDGAPGAQPALEGPGSIIGPYKLLQEIGAGGCGVVYMAEQQQPVRRRVALKVIKPGFDTRQVIARFEAERQALALMDHENIARVLDAGATDSGRPYFVMELVHGVHITEFCDRNRLPTRERLDLFVQVCRAVQHAHTKGVIHRDIKPANVLVTLHEGVAVPKVIDFGIAKATGQQLTDKTLFTQFAQMVGTPLYMSPEQAELTGNDVDTRTDVYSLGVLLYELLTGTTPMDRERLKAATFDEVLRILREEDPPTPSTRLSTMDEQARSLSAAQRGSDPRRLGLLVRGELDWIVMKALEKDRNRRYETVNGFALDVQRYLADEPVSACPPSALYRLRKLVRRNKGPLAAAAVVLLTLTGGIVGTGLGLVRAERAREAEVERAEGERRAKERAEANLALANDAVEKYLGTVTQDPLLSRFELTGLREKLLESAVPFFERLATQRGDDPVAEARRGWAHLRVAWVRLELGKAAASLKDAEAALAVFAPLAAASPDAPAYLDGVARAHHASAQALVGMAASPEAEQAYRRALAAYQEIADRRKGSEALFDLARCHTGLGNVLSSLWKFEKAEEAYVRAWEIRKEISAASPDKWEYRSEISHSLSVLGRLRQNLGHYAQAEADFRESLRLSREILESHKDVPACRTAVAAGLMYLGGLWVAQGEHAGAEKAFREAADIQKSLVDEIPEAPQHQSALMTALGLVGSTIFQSDTGRHGDAEVFLREALRIQEALFRKFPTPGTLEASARVRNDLGMVLAIKGELKEADKVLREALAAHEKLEAEYSAVPHFGWNAHDTYTNLGHVLRLAQRTAESLEYFEKAIVGIERIAARDARPAGLKLSLRNAHYGRADALEALGDWGKALTSREKIVELNRELLGPDDPQTLGGMTNVGRCLGNSGHDADALRIFEDALARMRAKIPDHPFTLFTASNVAELWLRADRGAEAVPLLDEIVQRAGGQTAHADLVFRVIDLRVRHFQTRGEASGCRKTVEMWERLNLSDGPSVYTAACYWAVTAAVRRASERSEDALRTAASEADLAMDRLGKAFAAGYDDFANIEKDADLEVLRDREDYRKLVAAAKSGK